MKFLIQNIIKRNSIRDISLLYILFFASVIFIYKAPQVVRIIFQVFLLYAFWRSKKDYFWLAFVFIIQNFPGALFSRFTGDIIHTFSLLASSPVGTMYFWMLFIVIALAKSLKQKAKYKLVVRHNLYFIFGYFLILVLIFGLYKWTAVTRTTLPWLFLIILPRSFKSEKDFVGFFNLIFSFVFFVIATQIFQISFGFNFAGLLGDSGAPIAVDELKGVARPVEGIFIPYLALFGSLFYMAYKKKHFTNEYLVAISLLSLVSIFITATRTWLISSLFIFGSFFLFIVKSKLKLIQKISLPLILLLLTLKIFPVVRQQIYFAIQRYETTLLIFEGDITAGGTSKRFDKRGPAIMAKFYESPFFGWGYGNEADTYRDEHVGFQNLLMQTGVFGFTLWLLFWLFFIIKMKLLNNILSSSNPYKNIPILFIIMLIGTLILNISSQWYNYLLRFLPGFTIIFLLALASYVKKDALKEEFFILEDKQNEIT